MTFPAPGPADTSSVRVGQPDGVGGLVDRDRPLVETPGYPGLTGAIGLARARLGSLGDAIAALDTRLEPALGSGSPHKTPGADPVPGLGDSPHVTAVAELANGIETLEARVLGLLNRLEV